MDILVFIILLFALQGFCLLVGGKSSKEVKNQSDYFLAGRQVKFLPLMMTFVATQVGGGLVLGAAEEAYKFGWSVLFYPLGTALGLMLLGAGMGRKLAEFNVPTVAQIFEKVYQAPHLKKIASLLSILSLFMILVAQFIASYKFMVSQGVDSKWLFIAFWGIVIAYTAVGGFKAVVATDLIQAQFFIVAFLFGFFWLFGTNQISYAEVLNMGSFSTDYSKLVGWILMPLFFMLIEQDMAQRCFAGASSRVVSRATFWSGVVTLFLCTIPVFFGIFAREIGVVVPTGASVLMTVISATTTPYIAAFIGCAIMAAIISTADSLINAISSNISQDFKFKLYNLNEVRAAQLLTAVISIAGIFCSFYFTNVVDILIQSYELSVSCLFIPILFALFRKQGHALSAAISVGFGIFGFILFRVVPVDVFKEILSILLSLVGYGIGEMIMIYRAKVELVKQQS